MLTLYTYRLTRAETHLQAARRGAAPGSALDVWSRLGLAGVAYGRGHVTRADSLYADAARRGDLPRRPLVWKAALPA